MQVRQPRAADWQELSELRVPALADAPNAFASTLEREAALPADVRRQRGQGGPAWATFIARADGVGVGMAAAIAEPAPGARQPLPSNPAVDEVLLRLSLDSPTTVQEQPDRLTQEG